jgi:outer membrane protein
LPTLLMMLALHSGTVTAAELDNLPETLADLDARDPVQERRRFSGLLGVLVVNTGGFIGGDERVTAPLPLVYFNYNDRLYWSIASVGGWLVKSDDRSFRLGLLAKARGGIDGDDAPYTGIFDRDASVDAGLNLAWRTRYVTLGASWLADVADRSHGQNANLRLSFPIRLSERWNLTPSVGAEWLDERMVDYYYGVTTAETAGGAPLYTGTASTQLRAGAALGYRLTRDWRITGGVSYTRLGDGLADSPLVSRDDNLLAYLGFSWSFRTGP